MNQATRDSHGAADRTPPPPGSASGSDGKDFTPHEKRVVWGITSLLTLRMIGFYLVLPVLSIYAQGLRDSTPLLVGMSVGIYGFSQLVFQVPFGAWSDRWGRRPVLTVGLLVFAVGSVVCALAETTLLLVVGRAIQGMGAIASVIVALLADLTRDQVRNRAMVTVGISIGGSFAFGLLLGPAAADQLGIPTIFWVTAGLTLLAIAILWARMPEPARLSHHEDVEWTREHLFEVLTNRQLLRLDFGVFNLHMVLTAIFVTVPFLLREFIALGHQWRFFLPLVAFGLVIMLSGARLSERPGRGRRVALAAQGLLVASLAVLASTGTASIHQPGGGLFSLVLGLFLFIAAFALLEPLFPALLTRLAQQANRGTAAGIFNMSMFSGAFVGGLISGAFLERNVGVLFLLLAGTSLAWLIYALKLHDPQHMSVLALALKDEVGTTRRSLVSRLLKVRGVEDVAWEPDRGRLLIRHAENLDHQALGTIVDGRALEAP